MNPSRAWLAVCGLHGAASLLVWLAGTDLAPMLTWQAVSWTDQPWTLWTSAWVHVHTWHLIGNLLALSALATFAWLVRPSFSSALAWLLAWPLTQLSLLLWPGIHHAVGLSGLLHGGAMVLAMQLLFRRIPLRGARLWGALLALGVVAKVAMERGGWNAVVWDPDQAMPVVQAMHLSGAAWGLLLGLAAACAPAGARAGHELRRPRARA